MSHLPEILQMVTACGYSDVETVGFHGLSPAELAADLKQAGVRVRSAHFDWDEFETRFDDILSALNAMECPLAVMPWLEPRDRPNDLAGWIGVAERLHEWAQILDQNGKRLAYHNHDFDLVEVQGRIPLDLILEREVHWQPDIGWLVASVPNPVETLQRWQGKIVSAHVKDVDPVAGQGDDRWRDLGQGVVDWASVLEVLQASPCSDLFVEHDDPPDARATLETGFRFLRNHTLVGAS